MGSKLRISEILFLRFFLAILRIFENFKNPYLRLETKNRKSVHGSPAEHSKLQNEFKSDILPPLNFSYNSFKKIFRGKKIQIIKYFNILKFVVINIITCNKLHVTATPKNGYVSKKYDPQYWFDEYSSQPYTPGHRWSNG